MDTLGAKAVPDVDDVRVDDRRVKAAGRQRYILLNKPRGYVTTRQDPEGRRTVMDLLGGVREYVYPVGRLDYDTEGLLLLTSDGDLAAKLTHPRHEVARVYEAIVMGDPSDDALDELRRGIFLDGRRTAEAGITRGSTVGKGRDHTTKIVLTLREGRNRQVREMCQRIGHPVRTLQRVRMGPLSLRGLPTGPLARSLGRRSGVVARGHEVGGSERAGAPRYCSSAPGDAVRSSPSSSGSISSGTGVSMSSAGGSKPSACTMSCMLGRSARSFRPKRIRNSLVVP